jgi:hypothetical protein
MNYENNSIRFPITYPNQYPFIKKFDKILKLTLAER